VVAEPADLDRAISLVHAAPPLPGADHAPRLARRVGSEHAVVGADDHAGALQMPNT
jgi:hypothetical protein